jgi:hypothetical protein
MKALAMAMALALAMAMVMALAMEQGGDEMSPKNNTIKNGGLAFPSNFIKQGGPLDGVQHTSPGMSIKDWFAGMVLSGIYSRQSIETLNIDKISVIAYSQADSMIKWKSIESQDKETN